MTPRFHSLRIAEVRRETADSVSLRIDVPPALAAEYAFIQGQHVTLRAQLAGQEVRRSYSICSAVQDDALRIAVKKTPGGLFSMWANETPKAGERIDVMPPLGHFNAALDPAAADLVSALADLYMRASRFDEAIASAEGALKIDADNTGAHRVLGTIYATMASSDSPP